MTHRAILFSGIAEGTSRVTNFLDGADCRASIEAIKALGAEVEIEDGALKITGVDEVRSASIDCGNSGTTMRLLLGLLAGREGEFKLDGDDSLRKRPMDRVRVPLKKMGADIVGDRAPVMVRGNELKSVAYRLPVASAQVKSAILLAGLTASGKTTVIEPELSRDHTERMLPRYGVAVDVFETDAGRELTVHGPAKLRATDVEIPGDPSSAAFFWTAALLVPDSEITTQNVLLNPTRTGFLQVLRQMGASIEISNRREVAGEEVGDVTVRTQDLHGVVVEGAQIPSLIDEVPLIALLATQAEGATVIRDAIELRYKETDRIDSVASNLKKLGADIETSDDGMRIKGSSLHAGEVDSLGDHRVAMMLAIAGELIGGVEVVNKEAVEVSYPTFYDDLKTLKNRMNG